jgi:hypothetical protein
LLECRPFCSTETGKTFDVTGSRTVRVALPGRAADSKRLATIQLVFAADGTQPKPTVIFRGAGKAKKREQHLYHPDVHVCFQANAWLDTATAMEWADSVLAPFLRDERHNAPTLLILDNLKAQVCDEFKQKVSSSHAHVWRLPPNCTHMSQPIDSGTGCASSLLSLLCGWLPTNLLASRSGTRAETYYIPAAGEVARG